MSDSSRNEIGVVRGSHAVVRGSPDPAPGTTAVVRGSPDPAPETTAVVRGSLSPDM